LRTVEELSQCEPEVPSGDYNVAFLHLPVQKLGYFSIRPLFLGEKLELDVGHPLNSFFEWGSLFLVASTVAFGVGAILTSKVIRAKQESAIADANKRAAEANEKAAALNERAAKAELELEQLKLPRSEMFNRQACRDKIRGKPKMRVELLVQKDDVGSYTFAQAVKGCLDAEGWTTIGPRPIGDADLEFSQLDKDAPPSVRAGVTMGAFAYIAKDIGLDAPPQNLLHAIAAGKAHRPDIAKSYIAGGIIWGGISDPALPDDLIKLIIGPKYHEW
jgi:hypothetical protein